jgi:cytidylate kinase
MWKNINLEKCLSYLNDRTISKIKNDSLLRPSITISRMTSAGGRTVASKLIELLQPLAPSDCSWTIFDKNLIEKVLEDHHLSKRIAEFLPENRKSLLAEFVENMRGIHPPTSKLVEQTVETIWNLAQGGYVVLVGRAANVITEKLDNVFHVRLVGSLERRISRTVEVYDMGRDEAREFIRSQDAAKRDYMRQYFGRDIDDPLLYHMVINTDGISYESAAQMISEAVISRYQLAPARIRCESKKVPV